jgi:hypothetical protein
MNRVLTHTGTSKNSSTGVALTASAFVAVAFTWLIHEFAHWLTGSLLGYEMAMTLNSVYPISGRYHSNEDAMLISAAGPIVTLVQAVIIYLLIVRFRQKLLFPFLFICFYSRLMATVMNIFNLNDEARVSQYLDIGTYTAPLLVTGVLFTLLVHASRLLKNDIRFNALTVVYCILISSILILSDQFFRLTIL